jgi:fermentation-respiration switch protein FrsA (DUF1100 family)
MDTATKPRPSVVRRLMLRFMRLVLIAYAVCCLLLFMLQGCIIFPGARTQGTPAARVHAMPGEQLVPLHTSNGDTIYLLFGGALTPNGKPSLDAATRPTLIFFYGNGMSMVDCGSLFDSFRRLNANVAVVEYPGYGMSSGKPTEKSIYAAADAAYEFVAHRLDVDARQIIPTGLSIGGAAAIDMAYRHPVAGVATFAAFISLPAMARKVMPWFPTSLFIKYRFDNEMKLRAISVPMLLVHGTKDTLVPFAMNGKLAAAAKGPVTRVPVEGADHNDIFELGGHELMGALGRFIEQVHDGSQPGEKDSPRP